MPLSSPVITRYRHANANLRTQLRRIIKMAGLKPWSKLFHNLRSTRQTELAEFLPAHVVCAIMGNSMKIADEHYLQVTPEHFRRALQNPVQHPHASGCTVVHGESETSENHDSTAEPMSPAGLEPTTYGLKVRCSTN